MLKMCMKFYQDILNVFRFIERSFSTDTGIYKVQRDITKIHNQELWFLHSARRRTEFNICMKFYEDILKGFKVIEST